jgi:hypothetical protein
LNPILFFLCEKEKKPNRKPFFKKKRYHASVVRFVAYRSSQFPIRSFREMCFALNSFSSRPLVHGIEVFFYKISKDYHMEYLRQTQQNNQQFHCIILQLGQIKFLLSSNYGSPIIFLLVDVLQMKSISQKRNDPIYTQAKKDANLLF